MKLTIHNTRHLRFNMLCDNVSMEVLINHPITGKKNVGFIIVLVLADKAQETCVY